jgi:hypothetical protein
MSFQNLKAHRKREREAAEHQKIKPNGKRPPLHDWDSPDWSILDERRGDLPAFPLHIFSDKMQALITRTSQGAGVTPAHVAVPLIGVVSGLIGCARRVKVSNSWMQATTCWTVVVGFSGTGKTPGFNVVRRVLKQIERDSQQKEKERERKHETKRVATKAALKIWNAKIEEAADAGLPPPEMPQAAVDPGKFIPLKLCVTDATIERLADLLQARPHGLVLVRDELSALFTNMSCYSKGQDDEFWLEAWNGDHYSVERMGRMLTIDHLLIGLVGGMQPDKLVKSFQGDHDGKYARVLFSWPDEPVFGEINQDVGEIDDDVLNIIKRVCLLAEFTDDQRLVDRPIPLDDGGLAQFVQFRQWVDKEKTAFEGREREWFAKATEPMRCGSPRL